MAGGREASAHAGAAGRWLALALGAFVVLSAGLFAAATLADREATLEQGRVVAENTAALFAEHADRALRVAELTALRAEALVARHGRDALRDSAWAELHALDEATPEVNSLWVIDDRGLLVAGSTRRDLPPLDLSDREYFMRLRDGAANHLSALARGRATGVWFFGWNQALREQGRFLGLVHAAVHADVFARLAEGLALGPEAQMRLLRADGALLAAWPLASAASAAAEAGQGLPGPGPSGFAEAAAADGAPLLLAWRPTPSMPAVAVVALSRAHVLAPFHRRLLRNGVLFGLSMALAGGAGLAALRRGRREAEARRASEERGAALARVLDDRLRLIASLQEGAARLRLAREAGGIGLWDLDLQDRRITLVGEVFGAWAQADPLGRPARRVPVRAAMRAIHPEDRPAVVAALTAAIRGGAPLAAEFRLAGAPPERWVGVRAEPHAAPEGGPGRLLGIAHDVTAAREAKHALEAAKQSLERRVAEGSGALAATHALLREGEARFRALFDASFQFMALLSPDGTVLDANAALLRIGAVPADAMVGRPYREAPWWPAAPALRARIGEALAEAAAGRFARCEAVMRDAAGAELAVDFSVTPLRDEDGLVSLLVAEARDVSALKTAQALLHEAQKMDTLGQLTGGVAHDFNNLLMVVLGNLAIARRRAGQQAPELLRYLDAATQAAERGATLTQRLLAFARRQDLRPAAVELRGLLLGLEALLRRSAGPLVQLAIEAPEGLPPAHVDPHALELALVNLTVNARDAMPQGGRLDIRLALAEEGWLTLAVSDTGTGMDEATLARAVEPFFTTKGPGQGTGLGLSMVHGLAAQSGGALLLESAPGRGTTATLRLPVSTARPAAAADVAVPPPATGQGPVLVVDDEALVLESTAALLAELGYEPVAAPSGEAALALLAGRKDWVAVVTDHAMPGMTGMMLAERLRALHPRLPVILATGHAGAWAEAPDAPVRLMKPYGLHQLSAALQGAAARAAE